MSGTLGFVEPARAVGKGDFIFDYRSVAVVNMDQANVYGRSSAELCGRDVRITNCVLNGPGWLAVAYAEKQGEEDGSYVMAVPTPGDDPGASHALGHQ